jgi:hypothetical protein
MDDIARAARNEYYRQWRAKNPEKVAETNRRYWLRKAEKMKEEETRAAIAAADPGQQEPGLDE